MAEGCRDPLVIWRGVLLDGHNRLRICEKRNIAYPTTTIDLPDRAAAVDWIYANQLGRRNLTLDQRRLLRGERYNAQKKAQGGTGANQHKQRVQNAPSAHPTAAAIALMLCPSSRSACTSALP